MSRLSSGVLALIACFAFPAVAMGQLCYGLPSFARGPFQLSANVAAASGSLGYGGAFATGGTTVFARLSAGGTSYQNAGGHSLDLGATVGVQDESTEHGRGACVDAFTVSVRGPGDLRTSGVGLGVNYGAAFSAGAHTELLPAFSLSVTQARTEGGPSQRVFTMGLVVGVVFDETLAIRPGILLPLSEDTITTAFALSFSANFGRKRT